MENSENAELTQLKEIQGELKDIRENTKTTGWFWRGVWQGAGAIVGSLAMVVVLGLILSFLGIIPGFGDIAHYLGNSFSQIRR